MFPVVAQLRSRFRWHRLRPVSRLAHAAYYLAGIDLFLYLLKRLFAWLHMPYGFGLGGWTTLLTIALFICLTILTYRWCKTRVLWRLRNRLIVTYILIGVIPVALLLAIGFISLYLFAGQFANFVVTSELYARLHSLQQVNEAITGELAERIKNNETPVADSLRGLKQEGKAWEKSEVCAWENGKPLSFCTGADGKTPFSILEVPELKTGAIVRDQKQLYLRTESEIRVNQTRLLVISSQPLDRNLLEQIAAGFGDITLYSWGFEPGGTEIPEAELDGGLTAKLHSEDNSNYALRSAMVVGTLPPAANFLDKQIAFGTPLPVLDWQTGKPDEISSGMRVRTRPSLLYGRLFAALGEFAKGVEYALLFVMAVFAIIVLIALLIGVRLTRTITGAIAHLYNATVRVNRGDLSHRIPVKSHDQLAALANSFNSMTASLENLLEEQREKQKLENELVIAQEVQAQLFPRVISQLSSLEVHGFCRPARTVSGDYYDFLTVDPQTLILAIGDVSGKGISAALLMATIHSAVRAYSLEGIPLVREMLAVGTNAGTTAAALQIQGAEVSPGTLLSLLNHQLYHSTPSEKYATLFLGFYDGRQRRLTYSNGGHLPPVILGPDGSVRRLGCGGTVVGLFDERSYDEGCEGLREGEIFLAYSDGVTEPENDFGEFGEQRLVELVWENRHQSLERISETVTAAVDDWIGAKEQPDDITLVLARAQ